MGEIDNALSDLEAAIQTSETLVRHARVEEMFRPLQGLERFEVLVGNDGDPTVSG